MNKNEDLMTPPEVIHTKEAGIQIVAIQGKLTYGTTQHVKDRMKDIFDKTADGYLIDMSSVDYVDSTGFGVLINFAKRIAEIDRKMAIIVIDEFVYDLFTISKFHLVFPIVKSKEEGLKVLKDEITLPLQLRDY